MLGLNKDTWLVDDRKHWLKSATDILQQGRDMQGLLESDSAVEDYPAEQCDIIYKIG